MVDSNVVLVPDLARLLRCTEKAVRSRVAAGQLPKPFKLGKALAWTSETILAWLSESSRAAARPPVRIVITTYKYKDQDRLQAIWKMTYSGNELKTTDLVPVGKDRDQAKLWAAEQIERVFPILMAKAGIDAGAPEAQTRKEIAPQTNYTNPKGSITFREFVESRFIPEQVRRWKESSQEVYLRLFRDHLLPFFGDLPLGAIDEDILSRFDGRIMKYKPNFRNLLLARVKKVFGHALKLRYVDRAPLIERHKPPKQNVETYSVEEVASFIATAEKMGPTPHLVALLTADLGLRAGEICGLPWSDVDLKKGEILIAHNGSKGSGNTPKGTVGRLTLSKALHRALVEHRKREPIGVLVLYRQDKHDQWVKFTQQWLYILLSKIAKTAGLGTKCSARFMRHVMITTMADRGAAPTDIQAHARHALISTTEGYLHTRRAPASRSVMARLDAARGESEDPSESKMRSKKSKKAAR